MRLELLGNDDELSQVPSQWFPLVPASRAVADHHMPAHRQYITMCGLRFLTKLKTSCKCGYHGLYSRSNLRILHTQKLSSKSICRLTTLGLSSSNPLSVKSPPAVINKSSTMRLLASRAEVVLV